jgi:hypothetical protein
VICTCGCAKNFHTKIFIFAAKLQIKLVQILIIQIQIKLQIITNYIDNNYKENNHSTTILKDNNRIIQWNETDKRNNNRIKESKTF